MTGPEVAPVINTAPHVTCPNCGHEFEIDPVIQQTPCPACQNTLLCVSVKTIIEWTWQAFSPPVGTGG